MTLEHASGLVKLLAGKDAHLQPFEDGLGLALVDAQAGWVSYRATAVAAHANASGAMHGGWIAGLLDAVTGAAVATILGPGETHATVSLHVSYLRAVSAGTTVGIEGGIVKEGGRIVTSTATVLGEGKSLARAEAICMRLPA